MLNMVQKKKKTHLLILFAWDCLALAEIGSFINNCEVGIFSPIKLWAQFFGVIQWCFLKMLPELHWNAKTKPNRDRKHITLHLHQEGNFDFASWFCTVGRMMLMLPNSRPLAVTTLIKKKNTSVNNPTLWLMSQEIPYRSRPHRLLHFI